MSSNSHEEQALGRLVGPRHRDEPRQRETTVGIGDADRLLSVDDLTERRDPTDPLVDAAADSATEFEQGCVSVSRDCSPTRSYLSLLGYFPRLSHLPPLGRFPRLDRHDDRPEEFRTESPSYP